MDRSICDDDGSVHSLMESIMDSLMEFYMDLMESIMDSLMEVPMKRIKRWFYGLPPRVQTAFWGLMSIASMGLMVISFWEMIQYINQ